MHTLAPTQPLHAPVSSALQNHGGTRRISIGASILVITCKTIIAAANPILKGGSHFLRTDFSTILILYECLEYVKLKIKTKFVTHSRHTLFKYSRNVSKRTEGAQP